MRIGCVLMAAGTASRFGENKLLYPLAGRPLLAHVLEAAPARLFARAVAVVSDAEVSALAGGAGYRCLINPNPARGQGTSIALGVRAMAGLDAAMFLVGDQPYLLRATLVRMLSAYEPGTFLSLAHGSRRGNPVIFPKDAFDALAALPPDGTGRMVLARHPARLLLLQAACEAELLDIDTRADLP